MPTRRFKTTLLCFAILFATACACAGQQNATNQSGPQYSVLEITGQRTRRPQLPVDNPQPLSTADPDSVDAGEKINQIVTRLALDAIPHTYSNDKDWGGQDRRWDGIDFRRENGKLETKRKWKMVNHGTWKKYSATLINPEQNFSVEVKNFHQAANTNLAFDIHFGSRLRFDARQSKWAKGVQLYSFSANGHGKIRLVVSCELNIDMDITNFPPDFVFTPTVTAADLIVDEFRIDRVSKLGGEIAQQVTRAARKVLDEKVSEKEAELVRKINTKLAENQDDFRLSLADSLKQKWTTEVKELLPERIQNALESNQR